MKKFKKLIAVVLTVILSLSVMSVVAFASTTDSLKRTDDGKTAFLIGTIQALPSITVQHIMS